MLPFATSTALSLLASLAVLPAWTTAVDLRQYFAGNRCPNDPRTYLACSNIPAGRCCNMRQHLDFFDFSCYGCPQRNAIHVVAQQIGGVNCGYPVRSRPGTNPNCITDVREIATGHIWCTACSVGSSSVMGTDRAIIDLESGKELQCQGQVDPDTLMIEGRAFNLTAMSTEQQDEITSLVAVAAGSGQLESLANQETSKRGTSNLDPLAKFAAFEYELDEKDEAAN